MLAKIDSCDNASEVIKSVNILMAIRWAAKSLSDVIPETISKCFRKAGVLSEDLEVISSGSDEDPFLEADTRMEIQTLISETAPTDSCPVEEFLSGDDDLAVCAGMDDDWNTSFLEQLDDQEDEEDDDGEDETSAPSPLPPSPKLKTYKEAAINVLEDVSHFLENRGHTKETIELGTTIDNIVTLTYSSLKQTDLSDLCRKN